MLITYNNNSNIGIDRSTTLKPLANRTNQAEATTEKPQTKKRFQNIRNGLTKSNRKLAKSDLTASTPLSLATEQQQQAEMATQQAAQRTSQLQLIVSKCRCEFYMIDFEDKIGDDDEQFSVQVKSNNLLATGISTSPTNHLIQPTYQNASLNRSSLNYSQILSNLNQSCSK